MIPSWYLLVPVFLPVLSGLAVGLWKSLGDGRGRNPFTLAVLLLNLAALVPVLLAPSVELQLFQLSDNLPIFFRTDDAGKVFAAVMALLWAVAGAYSFAYMEHEGHLRRYYSFYLVSLGVLMGLCFAGSIVTYYMFYELMTLLTVPLVVHEMSKDAVAAGIKYLIYSVLGASLVLLGVFVLAPWVESFSFAPGGVLNREALAGHEGTALTMVFLMLVGFGTKAGMFPLHGWLPTAHPVAPAPASAVLSGVITKAGVLGAFRLVYCFVGADFLRGTWVHFTWIGLTLFTVFMGSMLAYREDLLKKRLAWSSVSQVSYVLFGLATLHPLGVVGALLHVSAHALIKNTLFMSAGAIIHQTGKTRVSELRGIGRQMPIVMWCFTIASVGLVGIPPCLGFVSKWYLAQGALAMTGTPDFLRFLGPAVLLISALLTAGYLLTVTIRGFFPGEGEGGKPLTFEKLEPSWRMWLPMVILAALSVLLGLFPGALIDFFTGIAGAVL
ncbi:MAG: proton-conducting membrane transporter [Clostridia bacterium]|nr:proton-conducting membrane transporter [Clostridia bacterium]